MPVNEQVSADDLYIEALKLLGTAQELIAKARKQHELAVGAAKLNAETVRQMQARDAEEHEEFIARFGL